MKHTILVLMAAAMVCLPVHATHRTVTQKDGAGKLQKVIELNDTVVDGQAVCDTLSITTYEENSTADKKEENSRSYEAKIGWEFDNPSHRETLISIVAIVAVFVCPLLLIFIIFYFRYKNRKQKYRLIEQALASGQPLPEHLFNEKAATDIRSKGIKNICLGIGLSIFLWALTDEFSLACIGILIMFTGIGQVIIFYTQQEREK